MLLANIFVARIVSLEEYGQVGILQTTVAMVGAFSGFGLGLTATKFIADNREKNSHKTGNIISLVFIVSVFSALIFSSLLFFNSAFISSNILNEENLVQALRISSLALFFSTLNGAIIGMLSGFESFKKIGLINLLIGAITFPVLFYLTDQLGVNGYMLGFSSILFANVFMNLMGLLHEMKKIKINFVEIRPSKELSVLYKFSLPAALGGFLVGPINWIANTILVNSENGYTEMAYYNAANQWFYVLLFLPNIVTNVLLPIVSNNFSRGHRKESMKILRLSFLINLCFLVPFLALGIFFSETIMSLFGQEYTSSSLILIITFITVALMVVNAPIGNMFAVTNKMWTGLTMNLIWAVIFLIFSYNLVLYGALGICIARLIAYLSHTILQYTYIANYFGKQN